MQYDELLDAVQADRMRAMGAAARRRLLDPSRQGRTRGTIRRAARAWFKR